MTLHGEYEGISQWYVGIRVFSDGPGARLWWEVVTAHLLTWRQLSPVGSPPRSHAVDAPRCVPLDFWELDLRG
jgi:hypothetical protein